MITYLNLNQCLVCGGGGVLDYVYVDKEILPFHPPCYEEMSGETFILGNYFTRKEWLNFAGEFYTLAKRYVMENTNGDKFWYLNGKLHREDGPATKYANGERAWYLNGKYHREDGPAVEWSDGDKEWYLNGESFSEEEHRKRVKKR